jgi:glycosyltransferase involved in cell wall biosynthesis
VAVEIFVVDDSPEASAQAAVEDYRDVRVTYLRNPNPSGGVPSIARNLGWPRAKGAFVHFLDDDDIISDGHYMAVKSAFAAHPSAGMVFGRIQPFGNGPTDQLEHEKGYFADAGRKAAVCQRFGPKWAFVGQMLFGNAMLVCSASVLRRECVERLGGFDPNIRLMEDADFHVRVMRHYGAHFLDRVAVLYRIGNPSLMHSPNPDALQRQRERDGHHRMQVKYREQRGIVEFYLLALFARTALRVV